MKTLIYRLIYNGKINFLLRNLTLPLARLAHRKLPLSVSGKLHLRYGSSKFCLYTNQTCSVSQQIFYDGLMQYEFTRLFIHLIIQSETFLDVGANIGYFTVLGEKVNPALKTYSFEPSKGPLHYLQRNAEANNLKNVVIIPKALSDTIGKLTFHDVYNPKYPWVKHHLNGSGSLQNSYGASKMNAYQVEVSTLEAVVKEFDINQIDVIKLDTECTEHTILRSGLEVISWFRPIIISEVYPVIETQVQDVIDRLENYQIFHHKNDLLHQISSLHEVTLDENRNFVFCPKEKTGKIRLFIQKM